MYFVVGRSAGMGRGTRAGVGIFRPLFSSGNNTDEWKCFFLDSCEDSCICACTAGRVKR